MRSILLEEGQGSLENNFESEKSKGVGKRVEKGE